YAAGCAAGAGADQALGAGSASTGGVHVAGEGAEAAETGAEGADTAGELVAAEAEEAAEGAVAELDCERRAAIDIGCERKPGAEGAEGAAGCGTAAGVALPLPFFAARASALAAAFASALALASALRWARISAREGL